MSETGVSHYGLLYGGPGDTESMERRTLLTAGLAVAAGLAGCNTDDPDEGPTTTGTATDTPTRTATPDPAEAPTADGLDDYRFDVGS